MCMPGYGCRPSAVLQITCGQSITTKGAVAECVLALCGQGSERLPQILSAHCQEPHFTDEEPKVHKIGASPRPHK